MYPSTVFHLTTYNTVGGEKNINVYTKMICCVCLKISNVEKKNSNTIAILSLTVETQWYKLTSIFKTFSIKNNIKERDRARWSYWNIRVFYLLFYLYKSSWKNVQQRFSTARETIEGWPLLTVETEVNGDSKRTNEKGPFLVNSLGLSCRYKRFLFCLDCSSWL